MIVREILPLKKLQLQRPRPESTVQLNSTQVSSTDGGKLWKTALLCQTHKHMLHNRLVLSLLSVSLFLSVFPLIEIDLL